MKLQPDHEFMLWLVGFVTVGALLLLGGCQPTVYTGVPAALTRMPPAPTITATATSHQAANYLLDLKADSDLARTKLQIIEDNYGEQHD